MFICCDLDVVSPHRMISAMQPMLSWCITAGTRSYISLCDDQIPKMNNLTSSVRHAHKLRFCTKLGDIFLLGKLFKHATGPSEYESVCDALRMRHRLPPSPSQRLSYTCASYNLGVFVASKDRHYRTTAP